MTGRADLSVARGERRRGWPAFAGHDAAQAVGAEVIPDFPDPWTIEERIIRLDHPARIVPDPEAPLSACHRREPPCTG